MVQQNRPPNPFLRDQNRRELEHYAIYDHPKDYPDKFVVRRWAIVAGEEKPVPLTGDQNVATTDTLEEARALIPQGLYRIPRMPEDDPAIAEVWI